MGGCCFTPKKRDFLWWYWLVLVSIVGIPMLLAVLYVAQGRGTEISEAEKQRRGKVAAWIFWSSAYLLTIAAFFVVRALLMAIYGMKAHDYYLPANASFAGWATLAAQFFFALVAANGAFSLIQKRQRLVKVLLLVVCACLYTVFIVALCPDYFHLGWPGPTVMQFLVCILPARYWSRFKESPDTHRAWMAFGAYILGATLFFAVSEGLSR